jgi:hypothetical protein
MDRKSRLFLLLFCLLGLVAVGLVITKSFDFLLSDFWFTSGFFLLLLLSLIDQPFFSKDSNVMVNALAALPSLLLVAAIDRDAIWNAFLIGTLYLIVSSGILMWLRSKELIEESLTVQFFSRLNRIIGRPECLFSAFFLWGAASKFGLHSPKSDALFMFWAVFMVLNIPAISALIAGWFGTKKVTEKEDTIGRLQSIVDPSRAILKLNSDAPRSLFGREVVLRGAHNPSLVVTATVTDDRSLMGVRVCHVASEGPGLATLALDGPVEASLSTSAPRNDVVGVVGKGSDIGTLKCTVRPDAELREGSLLTVSTSGERLGYFQVVSAKITTESVGENLADSIETTAIQLGSWEQTKARFETFPWVAPPGNVVRQITSENAATFVIPEGRALIGYVPGTTFPVHVGIDELVTHNTAILGITGSGKSYIAFDLIENIIGAGIRVLVLDLSGQYKPFLRNLDPVAIQNMTKAGESGIQSWLDSSSTLGVYSFSSAENYTQSTAKIAILALRHCYKKARKRPGVDERAALCIVLEEAHALIPEFNQVTVKADSDNVNKTARTVLQGRKYGLGTLLITQRTANVTKTILNQCNTIVALQSFDKTGLEFMSNYVGNDYAHAISNLPLRHALLVGKASSSARPIIFRANDQTTKWNLEEVSDLQSTEDDPLLEDELAEP